MNKKANKMKSAKGRRRVVFPAVLFLACPFLIANSSEAAELEARVDRDAVQVGESLQLMLRQRGPNASGSPDLSVLEEHFEVLDIRQSQRTSIINGRVDQSFDWIITLEPLESGQFEIPSISLGADQSRPIAIRVEEIPTGASAPTAPAYLEIEVDEESPYVQGKVVLKVKLYLDASVRGGSLSDPDPRGAIVQRLGEDASYMTRRDGRECQVVERTYAIFPQESGELVIGPLRFEGTQRVERSRARRGGFRDPFADMGFGSSMFGSSMFDEFFGGGGQAIRARSARITLDVQAKPDGAAGTWWLPARSVELIERYEEEPPTFRVGEPVKRTLAIQAVGLSGAQMPELVLPNILGVKQYSGEALNETFQAEEETVAVKVQEVTLIPSQAGRTTLPAIELEWWDVDADESRTATIPAREIEVLDGNGQVVAAPIIAPSSGTDVLPPAEERPLIPGSIESGDTRLYAIGGGALLALLVTAFAVRRRRAARLDADEGPRSFVPQSAPAPARRAAESELRRACNEGDARFAAVAIVNLGRALFPDAAPASPGAVADALNSSDLREETAALDRARFSAGEADWSGKSLWSAYLEALRGSRAKEGRGRAMLPALYPSA